MTTTPVGTRNNRSGSQVVTSCWNVSPQYSAVGLGFNVLQRLHLSNFMVTYSVL